MRSGCFFHLCSGLRFHRPDARHLRRAIGVAAELLRAGAAAELHVDAGAAGVLVARAPHPHPAVAAGLGLSLAAPVAYVLGRLLVG